MDIVVDINHVWLLPALFLVLSGGVFEFSARKTGPTYKDIDRGFRAIPVEMFATWANPVETSNPGRGSGLTQSKAGLLTGVASFDRVSSEAI